MSIFIELSLLLVITSLVTLVMRLLKQPLVVGYILAGIIVGPYVLNLLHSHQEIELFSRIGIVLLLFIVGLHLNPKVIKEVGKAAFVTGIGQVIFTSVIGFGIATVLGFARIPALYMAVALTFSSTIIILKLLSDKKDLQKLYAKIAIGFLLVQDLVATVILIGITLVSQASGEVLATTIAITLLKAALILLGLVLLSRWVLPRFLKFVAHSQEYLFLFSLTWGTGLAALFLWAGLSVEVGALVAGVTLSVTPYADEVASRLKPLRDFFIILFFILLGSQLVLGSLGSIIAPAVILSLFVLVGNPLIVLLLMNGLGFSRRTGFLAGLTVAQISEFSLILATLGLQLGHLTQEVVSLITLVGLITISGSTYLILYGESIFSFLDPILQWTEFGAKQKKVRERTGAEFSAALFGFNRVGHDFARTFKELGLRFFVVDFNPHSITYLQRKRLNHYYGDASDVEFLDELPLAELKVVISTVPDMGANSLLIQKLREQNAQVVIILTAPNVKMAKQLYDKGASYVVLPHYLGAEHITQLLHDFGVEPSGFDEKKLQHMVDLDAKMKLFIEESS